jgi:hypothetical protein
MQSHLDARNSLLSLVFIALLGSGLVLPAAAQFDPVTAQHEGLNRMLPTMRLTCGEKQKADGRKVQAHFRLQIRRPLANLGAAEARVAKKDAKQGCVDNLNAVLRAKTYCDPTSCFESE